MTNKELFLKHKDFLLTRIEELHTQAQNTLRLYEALNGGIKECEYHLSLTYKNLDALESAENTIPPFSEPEKAD